MSSDALTGMESSDCHRVDPVTGSEKTLSDLLEQEYFLLKVLAYVVEDGLHECRRVCRRWRDACGKLPVTLHRVFADTLQKAADLFPEAERLSMREWISSVDIIETHIVPQLPRLANLKDLSLYLDGVSIDLRSLVACFSSMQHLRSLSLYTTHEDTLHCFVHDLRYLTKLTSLFLDHKCVLHNDLDPNSCVQGLRQLTIPFHLLINERGEFVFPMLTGLTNLIIGGAKNPEQFLYNLQSIVPCAANLQSLSIHTTFVELSLTGPSPWRSFLHLSSLTIGSYVRRDARFFEALQQMRQLTSLTFIVASDRDKSGFLESMPSLTGLRSLSLSYVGIPGISYEITKRLSVLSQLTRLCLSDLLEDQPLRLPKELVDLCLFSKYSFPEDLSEQLAALTDLTSLKMHSYEELHLFHSDGMRPIRLFNELRQLKKLSLRNVCLDRPFLDAFVALTGLMELRLGGRTEQMDHRFICQQLSLLSDLSVLEIPYPKLLVDSQAGVPQGCMPKLRKIVLPLEYIVIDDDTHLAMMKAFPSLRNVE